MPTSPARTADDIAETIRSLIDRVAEAKLTQEMAKRGQDVAGIIAERGSGVGDFANETWRDTKPLRRDAVRRFARATDDASKWSNRTWRKSLRPALRDLWSQRAVAAGAAGAAVPAGRELVDTAAVRLGLKRREERHWTAFFLGILIGAAAGAIAALLTTPKRGEEMRRELGVRAEEVRREVAQRADEIATKARDEWVPIFQNEPTNGHTSGLVETDPFADRTGAVTEGAAGSGAYGDVATDPFAADVETGATTDTAYGSDATTAYGREGTEVDAGFGETPMTDTAPIETATDVTAESPYEPAERDTTG